MYVCFHRVFFRCLENQGRELLTEGLGITILSLAHRNEQTARLSHLFFSIIDVLIRISSGYKSLLE